MDQNFNLYHIFYTVATCKNISLAAKELYISQPAVSKSIQKLESSLSLPLFQRSKRGVTLTYEGELLYRQVSEAFSSIRYGEEQLKKLNVTGGGQLTIGVSTTLCKYVLLPYLHSFMKKNPQIKVSIACQPTFQTIESLEKGTIDIGLIGEPEQKKYLEFHPLTEIEDIFVASQNYLSLLNHSNKENISLFSNATLMLLDKNNMTRQYIDPYLEQMHIHAEQILEVNSMDLLIDFAKIDLGIACVIENFVAKDLKNGSLVKLLLSESLPKRKIGLASYTKFPANNSAKKFMEHLLQ